MLLGHVYFQVIEVQHPESPDGKAYEGDTPAIRFGVFGAGRPAKQEMSRHDFASRYGIQSFDTEFDQVGLFYILTFLLSRWFSDRNSIFLLGLKLTVGLLKGTTHIFPAFSFESSRALL